jgi:hypothetical protein
MKRINSKKKNEKSTHKKFMLMALSSLFFMTSAIYSQSFLEEKQNQEGIKTSPIHHTDHSKKFLLQLYKNYQENTKILDKDTFLNDEDSRKANIGFLKNIFKTNGTHELLEKLQKKDIKIPHKHGYALNTLDFIYQCLDVLVNEKDKIKNENTSPFIKEAAEALFKTFHKITSGQIFRLDTKSPHNGSRSHLATLLSRLGKLSHRCDALFDNMNLRKRFNHYYTKTFEEGGDGEKYHAFAAQSLFHFSYEYEIDPKIVSVDTIMSAFAKKIKNPYGKEDISNQLTEFYISHPFYKNIGNYTYDIKENIELLKIENYLMSSSSFEDLKKDKITNINKIENLKDAVKKNNIFIQKLAVWFNEIGNDTAENLQKVFKKSKFLQTLELHYVNETYKSDEYQNEIIDLIEKIKENISSLKEIDLSRNYIGPEGVNKLVEIIKKNKTLKKMYLSYNEIKDEGAKALAELIKESKSLKTLIIYGNYIKDEGAKALAQEIEESESLHTLDFSYNEIKDEGAKSLVKALLKSKSLNKLNLSKNNIGNKVDEIIKEAMETCPKLDLKVNYSRLINPLRDELVYENQIKNIKKEQEESSERKLLLEVTLSDKEFEVFEDMGIEDRRLLTSLVKKHEMHLNKEELTDEQISKIVTDYIFGADT